MQLSPYQREKLQQLAELRDPSLRIQRFLTERVMAEAVNKLDLIKGDKGDKGDSGKDGKNGLNGIDGKDGKNGIDGKDGKNGLNGIDGKDGKNGIDGKSYTINEIISALEKRQKPIEYKNIKGTPDVSDLPKLVAFLKAGGFRGGGDTVAAGTGISIAKNVNGVTTITNTGVAATWYEDEVLTFTDGINYTLAHLPSSVVFITVNGQKQKGGGTDYTRTGTSIVFVTTNLVTDVVLATYS